ncbi:MAG: purine-nucleoside phosphorylase [Armatimonadetes bacterium]|nr:purine-nucleoside phosphorylase [Armatimonadota bacterium]
MLFNFLADHLAHIGVPRLSTLVVLGSGMGGAFGDAELTPVATLPTGVAGHRGMLAMLGNPDDGVLLSLGRRHLYEGVGRTEIESTVRAAADCGARLLVLTNAAGALNPQLSIGNLMLITTAFAMPMTRLPSGTPTECNFSSNRYPQIEVAALQCGVALQRGSYAMATGPSYETRAEIRMLRRLGADAVGMSTLIEAAAGKERGMEVVGMSLITNIASEAPAGVLDHHHVVVQGAIAVAKVRKAIEAILDAVQ